MYCVTIFQTNLNIKVTFVAGGIDFYVDVLLTGNIRENTLASRSLSWVCMETNSCYRQFVCNYKERGAVNILMGPLLAKPSCAGSNIIPKKRELA